VQFHVTWIFAGENGIITWEQVKRKIAPGTYYIAQTGLVAIENTHNMAGGTVMPIEVIDEICEGAHKLKLPVHMDGARVFNAAAALGKPVRELTRNVDSVMFCLSKGLGAPVGSLLVSTESAIRRARLYRKRLGGGMRQAGVLAAAGMIALDESPARLHEDHRNARYLAERLSQLRSIRIDLSRVCTNIVIFDISDLGLSTVEFSRELKCRGVLMNGISPSQMRAVTHMDVSRDQCAQAAEILAEVVAQKHAATMAV